ncbi:hypothetical protein CTheo_2314 [Ceratobasidium theobromae]|uniref:Serine/threonine-protein phosphatase n=1 Tax=Ceratobasidium theobromae TaxID=1582974 RepID=A0A5N5QRP3_9AGAM|nr:hypothetical protein CTheo_2314 [Ceratobasidium theobromae]
MAEQIEKAFQKQHLFQDAKVRAGKKVVTKTKRWYKDVGLGFKTPAEAINGTYIDKKCPFTGDVSIRGRILTGRVVSTKMTRTIIIRRDYLHYIPKYNRYEKRHKNLAAHASPAFRIEIGDTVTVGKVQSPGRKGRTDSILGIGQCRPLSKTVRFNLPRADWNWSRQRRRENPVFGGVVGLPRSLHLNWNPTTASHAPSPSRRRPPLKRLWPHQTQYSLSRGPRRQLTLLLQPDPTPATMAPIADFFKSLRSSKDAKDANGSAKRSKKGHGTDGGASPALETTTLPPEDLARPPSSPPPDGPNGVVQSPAQPSFPEVQSSTPPMNPVPIDIPTTTTILSNPNPSSSPGPGSNPEKVRTIDIDDMINRLLEVGYSAKVNKSVCLKNNEITAICQAAREVFLSQPTLIELSPPVKIVGDVHGQYSDLIRLFEMCGFPPQANYLFLGDYVDRGKQSLETILLLLCYKVKYPENFFLLRGNHECANVTRGKQHPLPPSVLDADSHERQVYGFYDECKRRCNIKIWKTFIDVFNCLPIAAVVASKIFCVHGGLSPSLHSMDDIKRIQRPTDVPDYGLLNDLLWSDPSDNAVDWEDNERGVSYCFGKSVINDFLVRYDMDLICRAHMVVEDGYEFWNDRTLVTVFSAPNYCGEFDNYGACMSVSEDLLCAFELLKPLDGPALRKEMTKVKRKSIQQGPTPAS